MNKLSSTTKKIIRNIIILAPIEIIFGFFLLRNTDYFLGHVFGIVLGTITSVSKIWWLERSLENSMDKDSESSAKYYKFHYFLRSMMTMAVLLLAGLLHPNINLISTGIGLINMTVATYLYKILNKNELQGL